MATGAQTALRVEHLTVRFGRGAPPAIEEVGFVLAPGEGLVVSGPPGSGKSCLLRAIAGLIAYEGSIEVFGNAPGTNGARARIGMAPEGWPYGARVRAGEVLALCAELRGSDPADLARRVGLVDLDRDARSLEVEDARRLSLACALAGDPDVLLLDDPWEFPETVGEIEAALARGAAVLVASPDPGGLPALCGREMALRVPETAA